MVSHGVCIIYIKVSYMLMVASFQWDPTPLMWGCMLFQELNRLKLVIFQVIRSSIVFSHSQWIRLPRHLVRPHDATLLWTCLAFVTLFYSYYLDLK